jgi:hypothetical protein
LTTTAGCDRLAGVNLNTERTEWETAEERAEPVKDATLPRSWLTPRFSVEATETSVSMRRRRPWLDAATLLVFVFYATTLASGTLAYVDPLLPLLGITLSSIGFMVAGLVRAERRSSAPFSRFVRRELEAATMVRDDAYRGERSNRHVLLVDGRSFDARPLRKIVIAHRAAPQRYGPSRQFHTVCLVLDSFVVRVEYFENGERAARMLGRALARAFRIESTPEIIDETYAGGGATVAVVVAFFVVEVFLVILVPMFVVLFGLEKNPPVERAVVAGVLSACVVIGCDLVIGVVNARLMRTGMRRHLARVFGVEI